MDPTTIEALQNELRNENPGAVLTSTIVICEFYDPTENQRVVTTMGCGADGFPLTPWLAGALLDVATQSGITAAQIMASSDEDDEEDYA